MDLEKKFRHIPDFPKKGIDFIDVTTVLGDAEAFSYAIDRMAELAEGADVIVGSESRGFLFGAPIAYKLGIGFVPVRKKGKLPYETICEEYELEYGSDELEMHSDAIKPGQKVVIVDDLLATGGTVGCMAKMVRRLGGEILCADILVELTNLPGREKLNGDGIELRSVCKFAEQE